MLGGIVEEEGDEGEGQNEKHRINGMIRRNIGRSMSDSGGGGIKEDQDREWEREEEFERQGKRQGNNDPSSPFQWQH